MKRVSSCLNPLSELNSFSDIEFGEIFRFVCGSPNWIRLLNKKRPFDSLESTIEASGVAFAALEREELQQAFAERQRTGSSDIVEDAKAVALVEAGVLKQVHESLDLVIRAIGRFSHVVLFFDTFFDTFCTFLLFFVLDLSDGLCNRLCFMCCSNRCVVDNVCLS